MENLDKEIRQKIEFSFADDDAVRDPALDIPPQYELYVTSMDDGRALVNVDVAIGDKAPDPCAALAHGDPDGIPRSRHRRLL